MMSERPVVLLFVKAPVKGQVKSRLSRDLNEDFVLRLYESMALDTVDVLKAAGYPFRICFTPPDAYEAVRAWLGQDHSYLPQTGIDLGERMEQAFVRVFSEGADRAVLIGSDIPGLPAAVIQEAIVSLATHDAAIGPANDGGYYLIGFRRESFSSRIFPDMPWSTPGVFGETMKRFKAARLSVQVLPECIDADTREDLKELLAGHRDGETLGSRTRALLERHRKSIM
jgi:uncharacterized protein